MRREERQTIMLGGSLCHFHNPSPARQYDWPFVSGDGVSHSAGLWLSATGPLLQDLESSRRMSLQVEARAQERVKVGTAFGRL